MTYTRYAIYFVPHRTDLARFGAGWLGWDINTGLRIPLEHHPVTVGGCDFDHAALTERPRKYGFHATLRAPFALGEGCDYEHLVHSVTEVAKRHKPFDLALKLSMLGRFFALVPDAPSAALQGLAADLVTDLDALRQPLGDQELARRRRSRLTPAQDALLIRWGYPYVLDEFRFHMTLTGPVPKPVQPAVAQTLGDALAPILAKPQRIGHLCIAGEADDGYFHSLQQIALTGEMG